MCRVWSDLSCIFCERCDDSVRFVNILDRTRWWHQQRERTTIDKGRGQRTLDAQFPSPRSRSLRLKWQCVENRTQEPVLAHDEVLKRVVLVCVQHEGLMFSLVSELVDAKVALVCAVQWPRHMSKVGRDMQGLTRRMIRCRLQTNTGYLTILRCERCAETLWYRREGEKHLAGVVAKALCAHARRPVWVLCADSQLALLVCCGSCAPDDDMWLMRGRTEQGT